MSSNKQQVPQTVANGKYQTAKRLGAGCFGEVHRGFNTEDKTEVAIKFEEVTAQAPPQLQHEADILARLSAEGVQGIARFFHFGREERFNFMVFELLGHSLEDRVQKCDQQKLTPQSTVLIAEQVLSRIEYLHSKCLVHRDIKPENFMFGVLSKVHHLYLIDFGLSKEYWNKKHCMMKTKLSLTGTARYASRHAHNGFEQSRRDDLEAIGHMLLYFLRGSLPWSGLEAKTKQEKYRRIKEKKEQVPLDELCQGHPQVFKDYLQYARELEFTDKPEYAMLRERFSKYRESLQKTSGTTIEDHSFQWFANGLPENVTQKGPLVPLVAQTIVQPDEQQQVKSKGGFFCCGGGSKVRED